MATGEREAATMSATRLRLYAKERPRRGDLRALLTFDAAIDLMTACFELAVVVAEKDRSAVNRMRWAARQIMKAARRRAKGKK
jgi:hypothetical protein